MPPSEPLQCALPSDPPPPVGAAPGQDAARSSRTAPARYRAHPRLRRRQARGPGPQSSHKVSVLFVVDRSFVARQALSPTFGLSGLVGGRMQHLRCKEPGVAIADLSGKASILW